MILTENNRRESDIQMRIISHTNLRGQLIIMRGVSGSGKSTLSRQIVSQSERGVVLSTVCLF